MNVVMNIITIISEGDLVKLAFAKTLYQIKQYNIDEVFLEIISEYRNYYISQVTNISDLNALKKWAAKFAKEHDNVGTEYGLQNTFICTDVSRYCYMQYCDITKESSKKDDTPFFSKFPDSKDSLIESVKKALAIISEQRKKISMLKDTAIFKTDFSTEMLSITIETLRHKAIILKCKQLVASIMKKSIKKRS